MAGNILGQVSNQIAHLLPPESLARVRSMESYCLVKLFHTKISSVNFGKFAESCWSAHLLLQELTPD